MGTRQEGPRGFEMRDVPEAGAAEASRITFASFVLSLSTQALLHLGVSPGEEISAEEARPEVNLPLARQVVDMLEMIQTKTQGNLDDEESRLLASLLHDLHMRFVEASKA